MINQWLTLTESDNKEYPIIRGIEKKLYLPSLPMPPNEKKKKR